MIKLPYAGTNLTIHLLFYPHEPWMPPEMTFSDIPFSSSITVKDLEDQVLTLTAATFSVCGQEGLGALLYAFSYYHNYVELHPVAQTIVQ